MTKEKPGKFQACGFVVLLTTKRRTHASKFVQGSRLISAHHPAIAEMTVLGRAMCESSCLHSTAQHSTAQHSTAQHSTSTAHADIKQQAEDHSLSLVQHCISSNRQKTKEGEGEKIVKTKCN